MSNVLDFTKKLEEKNQGTSISSKTELRLVKSSVSTVDFKSRKLVKTETSEELVEVTIEAPCCLDMSNFNTPPADSNFAFFSDAARVEHSEHILQYFHELDFDDICHFITMGVLDKKKAAEKLNRVYKHSQDGA